MDESDMPAKTYFITQNNPPIITYYFFVLYNQSP